MSDTENVPTSGPEQDEDTAARLEEYGPSVPEDAEQPEGDIDPDAEAVDPEFTEPDIDDAESIGSPAGAGGDVDEDAEPEADGD